MDVKRLLLPLDLPGTLPPAEQTTTKLAAEHNHQRAHFRALGHLEKHVIASCCRSHWTNEMELVQEA